MSGSISAMSGAISAMGGAVVGLVFLAVGVAAVIGVVVVASNAFKRENERRRREEVGSEADEKMERRHRRCEMWTAPCVTQLTTIFVKKIQTRFKIKKKTKIRKKRNICKDASSRLPCGDQTDPKT